jgi:hypothetical protein
VAFTINDGAVDFIIGDIFTFTVTKVMGEEHWETKRWNTNYDGLNGYELILCGPGTSGDDQIYVGAQTYFNATSAYYNWRLQGFTGYSGTGPSDYSVLFAQQPGAIPDDVNCYAPQMQLRNISISYWFVANGRRIIVVANCSGVYESCYLGFLLPYGTPASYPLSYPLVVGGSAPSNLTLTDKAYSSQSAAHRCFADPGGSSGQGALALYYGNWVNFRNWSNESSLISGQNVWPYLHTGYTYTGFDYNHKWIGLQQNIDGSYPLFPLILTTLTPTKNTFGELQGCFAVPGFGLTVEDTFTISGKTYLAVKNIFRTVTHSWWALLLE